MDTHDVGVPPCSLLAMRAVSADGVAEALGRLYDHPGHLRQMSLAAHRNATRPAYDWGQIADRWLALFDELLDDLARPRDQENTAS